LHILIEVYHSFNDTVLDEEFLNSINPRERHIINMINNSIISLIYIVIRRLLEEDKQKKSYKAYSLLHLHIKFIKNYVCLVAYSDDHKTFKEIQLLNNSQHEWEALKKYINKNLAHNEKNNIAPPSWSDIMSIFEDIRKYFDCITQIVEIRSYTFDSRDAKQLATSLFNKLVGKVYISEGMVYSLLKEQFHDFAKTLSVKEVENNGIDNKTFRLGNELLIRMPSAQGYAAQVAKEQLWLPKLAKHLSLQIPTPVALGMPNKLYPWNWSIYKWIEGKSANQLSFSDAQLETIAVELAKFLKELHAIDTTGAPQGGEHNYYRGCEPLVYDQEALQSINDLEGIIDTQKAKSIWAKALNSKWEQKPVWVHGDLTSGNILIQDGRLNAIIDFGCMCIGDPACDLTIAWTFLKGKARNIFKEQINII